MIKTIRDDFSLSKISDSGQCFRASQMPDGSWRFITGSHILYISQLYEYTYEISCDEKDWQSIWIPYFDLNRSYREVRSMAENDPYLKKISDYGAGIRILRQEHWETLITFIISQRKNIPSIRSCVEELSCRYGTPSETPFGTVYTFPSAEQLNRVTLDELRECRLGYRAPYVRNAIDLVSSGTLNLTLLEQLDDNDLISALKSIKGAGIKIASCVSLFSYGRTSAAPVDTWIRKVIESEYQGQDPFPVLGSAAGIFQQYMFYYAQTHKQDYSL